MIARARGLEEVLRVPRAELPPWSLTEVLGAEGSRCGLAEPLAGHIAAVVPWRDPAGGGQVAQGADSASGRRTVQNLARHDL